MSSRNGDRQECSELGCRGLAMGKNKRCARHASEIMRSHRRVKRGNEDADDEAECDVVWQQSGPLKNPMSVDELLGVDVPIAHACDDVDCGTCHPKPRAKRPTKAKGATGTG